MTEAIEMFRKSRLDKLLIIAQTTFSVSAFQDMLQRIESLLKEEKVEIVIKNTICNATECRQKETEKIAKNVDYMIIVGGKNSSNTKKLYDIAKQCCQNTICIENENELNLAEMRDYDRIGIMAGASTPMNIINAVRTKIEGVLLVETK